MDGVPDLKNDINSLPNELIQNIIQFLRVKELLRCRLVCKRWRENVDALNEAFWKIRCQKDIINSVKDYKKSNLTWAQLYKSLTLWSKIQNADFHGKVLCKTSCNNFVIRNGVIGIPNRNKSVDLNNGVKYPNDCIVYYDINTLQEIRRELFDIEFLFYEEFNDFYVLGNEFEESEINEVNVYAIPKNTMKPVNVGKARLYGKELTVLSEKVLFRNEKHCIVSVQMELGKLKIETSKKSFCKSIVTFSECGNKIYILAEDGTVYLSQNGSHHILVRPTDSSLMDKIDELSKYGINWDRVQVRLWLGRLYTPIHELTKNLFSTSGKMVVMASTPKVIRFYYNPYYPCGGLNLCEEGLQLIKPSRTCNVDRLHKFDTKTCSLNWMDTVCTQYGQKIFVLTDNKAYVLKVNHGDLNKLELEEEAKNLLDPFENKKEDALINIVELIKKRKRKVTTSKKYRKYCRAYVG